ncbi:cupredoxin domain-containing protein [Dasania marina]|uniref:cupredoxin domain-containing protein n=1 Tax=Dasania marina TaxID=471499 RepID=UPI0030DDCEAD|tara:strand:- start:43976 stop:44305 length:330 start_codon:yes stop_codon:yes gene_type:complete
MQSKNIVFAILLLLPLTAAYAETPIFHLVIKDHLFFPSDFEVPANTKVKLLLHNQDASAEEFESYELNREKVIEGGRKAVIFIGPLPPGDYPFFGEFYPKTAQGIIRVK